MNKGIKVVYNGGAIAGNHGLREGVTYIIKGFDDEHGIKSVINEMGKKIMIWPHEIKAFDVV